MDPKLAYKYRDLAEVVTAFRTGELGPGSPLVIGPDETAIYSFVNGGPPKGETAREKIFDGGSATFLLQEALRLLNVPCRYADDSEESSRVRSPREGGWGPPTDRHASRLE